MVSNAVALARIALVIAAFAFFFSPTFAAQQTTVVSMESSDGAPRTESENGEAQSDASHSEIGSAITVVLGLDLPSQYFSRGIFSENQGLILQPYADISATLYQGAAADWFHSLAINFGIWNSLHEGSTGNSGPNNDPRAWFKADFYAGVQMTLFENLSFGVSFLAYSSPNDSFETIDEFAFDLAFHDQKLWVEDVGIALPGFTGFQPHLTIAVETENQTDGGASEGVYLELGLEPAFTLIEDEVYPLTPALPMTAGFSLNDYYEDESGVDSGFGYFDFGLNLSMPLAFMGSNFGEWNLATGVHFLILSDNAASINSGDDFETILSLGLSTSF